MNTVRRLLMPLWFVTTFQDLSWAECSQRLTVGVSLPLTAGATSSGEAVRNGIQLADEIYDKDSCVTFHFEDDQLLAKNTVANVKKFLTSGGVNGLIIYGTPTALAVADIAEKSRTTMIALSILNKVVEGRSYVMKHWCSAEKLDEALGRESRRRGYRAVAIVSTQNDAMLGLRDLYRSGKYTEVSLDEEFVRDNFDFRAVITRILRKKVSAVYVLLYPPQTAPFVKQLREQGFKGEVFGVHNFEDPAEVKAADSAMEGGWFANGDDSKGAEFHRVYLERFKIEPAIGAGSGFDVAKMFIESAQQSLSPNEFLHKLRDFKGSFGSYGATSRNDFDFPAAVKVIKGGRFEIAAQ